MKLTEFHEQISKLIMEGNGDLTVCVFDYHNESHYNVNKVFIDLKEYMFNKPLVEREVIVSISI